MARHFCPYLATLNASQTPKAPLDYPSFENRCLVKSHGLVKQQDEPLLFPQQATFCLGAGHQHCSIYLLAQQTDLGKAPFDRDRPPFVQFSQNINRWDAQTRPDANLEINLETSETAAERLDEDVDELDAATSLHGGPHWGWIGAVVVFMVVLFAGSLVALYLGWQFALGQVALRDGVLTTVNNPVAPAVVTASVSTNWIIFTATSEPPAQEAPGELPPLTASIGLTFPVAVTATPNHGASGTLETTSSAALQPAAGQDDAQAPLVVVQPLPAQEQPAPQSSLVDINLNLPERRPTPVFDLPTSTPAPANAVPLTSTLAPTPAGTPVIIFGADVKTLPPGKCTMLRWAVENVKEVYYNSRGVNGRGEVEECIDQNTVVSDATYQLTVILPNGATQIYTATIGIILPTATPLPTSTFTPEPILTPTWTPQPLAVAPTPLLRRGVSLVAHSSPPYLCKSGETCKIPLLATNSGEGVDNLLIQLLNAGNWAPLLCRGDGVCAGTGSDLLLVAVGPGNSAYLELTLAIPADAAGQVAAYQINAISDGSGRTVASDIVTVEVSVQ